MSNIKDNLLGEGLSVEDVVAPHQKPAKFIDIPIDVVSTVSIYMDVVIKREASQKYFEVERILKNTKNMFSNGIKYNDDLWMQHTASSIREIICLVNLEIAFSSCYKSIPEYKSNSIMKDIIDRLNHIKSYLSDVVHFVDNPRLSWANKIFPQNGYGNMKKEDFHKQEESIFELICIELVYILNDIFEEYVVGNNS